MKETAFEKIMGNLATKENTTIEDVKVQCDYWRSQVDADIEEINELESLAIEYINE